MYVARDKIGWLYLFEEKPYKCGAVWINLDISSDRIVELPESWFPEVKWEDEEPTEVLLVQKKNKLKE